MSAGEPRDVERAYDALGGRYDVLTRVIDGTVLNRLRRQLLAHARGSVLEIAIGTGKNVRYYPRDCEISGVDFSIKMLEVARRRAAREGRAIEIHRGDAAALPFDDARFDTVVCTLGGCTFDDPARVFREMRRVCRPDGLALWLEHVRPPSPAAQAVLGAVAPLTKRVLGCDPTRDTERTIREAGWQLDDVQREWRGVLLAMRARPE